MFKCGLSKGALSGHWKCTSASPYKCMCQNVELQLLYSLHTLTKVMNVMTILA